VRAPKRVLPHAAMEQPAQSAHTVVNKTIRTTMQYEGCISRSQRSQTTISGNMSSNLRPTFAVPLDVVEVLRAGAGAAEQGQRCREQRSLAQAYSVFALTTAAGWRWKHTEKAVHGHATQQGAAEHTTTHQSPVLQVQMEPDLHWKRSQSQGVQ